MPSALVLDHYPLRGVIRTLLFIIDRIQKHGNNLLTPITKFKVESNYACVKIIFIYLLSKSFLDQGRKLEVG